MSEKNVEDPELMRDILSSVIVHAFAQRKDFKCAVEQVIGGPSVFFLKKERFSGINVPGVT